jgi:hypothetical protein
MTSTTTPWTTIVERAGVTPPVGDGDAAVRSRVERALAKPGRGASTEAESELALGLAASTGKLHDQLEGVQKRDRMWRDKLDSQIAAQNVPSTHPRYSIALAAATFVLMALGPVFSLPSFRTSSDFLFPLDTAALLSGVLMAVLAGWFLVAELVRIPFAGTRARLYGPGIFVIPVLLSIVVIVITQLRIPTSFGSSAAIGVGAVLQVVALLLYVAAFFAARRNRAEVRALADEAATTALDDNVVKLDRELHDEVARAVAKGAPDEFDRAAASGAVKKLYDAGSIPPDRAVDLLRIIG